MIPVGGGPASSQRGKRFSSAIVSARPTGRKPIERDQHQRGDREPPAPARDAGAGQDQADDAGQDDDVRRLLEECQQLGEDEEHPEAALYSRLRRQSW